MIVPLLHLKAAASGRMGAIVAAVDLEFTDNQMITAVRMRLRIVVS